MLLALVLVDVMTNNEPQSKNFILNEVNVAVTFKMTGCLVKVFTV